ncbi:hypothetical protein NQZ79_g2023 [Umbelopsis isabellina]|nr:hypothetical protein NQZ79_g2023 [Umbelopsis isabellina]
MPQQASTTDYAPGSIVFAKLKGYPWWPARIELDTDVPARVLKQKSRSKGPLWTVFFFGSKDYGFFGADSIRPFDADAVERDLKAKKFKTKDLELAVRQALDPSLLDDEEEEEEEEEDEEEEDEEEVPVKATQTRGSRKGKAEVNKRSKKINGSKADHTMDVDKEDDVKVEKAPVKRRSRIIEDDDDNEITEGHNHDRPAKMVSTTLVSKGKGMVQYELIQWLQAKSENEQLAVESHRSERSSASPLAGKRGEISSPSDSYKKSEPMDSTSDETDAEYRKTQKQLYHIRHKLQKLVYEKKPGEIPHEDYAKIDQVLTEIGLYKINYRLLKDTKIGKVMKSACLQNFDDDKQYRLRERCQKFMKDWKAILIASQSENQKTVTDGGEASAHAV